ncbi:MAG: CPBP family intramembrane metalloprotease [Anaerolineales bacterium]|nr:CPBP family intramembrane metalloprotease [Anaerolineales bacterium]
MNSINTFKWFVRLIIPFCFVVVLALLVSLRVNYLVVKSFIAVIADTIIYVLLAVIGWRVFIKKKVKELWLIPNVKQLFDLVVGASLVLTAISITQILSAFPVLTSLRQGDYSLSSLAIILLASYREEVFFRGYFLNDLILTLKSRLFSVIISGLVFGLIHPVSLSHHLFLSILGIILAYAAAETGSFWFSVGMHFSWNAFSGAAFSNSADWVFPNVLGIGIVGILVFIYIKLASKLFLRRQNVFSD